MKRSTRVYESGRRATWGPAIWSEMISELAASRELVWRLWKRDFLARYRQSFLGVFWAVASPLVMAGVFVFLRSSGVLDTGTLPVPYPLYALLSLAAWNLFATGVAGCTNSLVKSGSYIVKINLPKEAIVIASLSQAVVEFGVTLGIAAVACVIFQYVPPASALLYPLTLLPLLAFILAIGMPLALLNGVARDMGSAIPLITTFLLFVTPIMYQAPEAGLLAQIDRLNPLSALVGAPRDLLIWGRIVQPERFIAASALSFVGLIIAWRLFHLAEPRVVERV